MSWPTRTWTQNGWVDFKTPGPGPNPAGFPDDWKQHKGDIKGGDYWDVIDNPLFELAAEASGIDWNTWVAESHADIGDPGDQLVRIMTSSGSRSYTRNGTMVRPPKYEVMTVDEAYDRGFSDSDILEAMSNTSSSAEQSSTGAGLGVLAGMDAGQIAEMFDRDDDDDGRGGWGITPTHGNWIDDMETMYSWLTGTIKTHSLQDMPIVNRGPEGSDYGIDGDIWVHYGLDQPPQAPKEMDINYDFNLAELKPNTLAHYTTPEGYPVLDLSTESVAYEDTHYAQWTAQNEADAIAQENAPPTSYGEPVIPEGESAGSMRIGESDLGPTQQNKQRWTENVMKIIGSDDIANVNAWASAAGIKSINSRSDSDQIKAKYREHGGNLPT